MSAPNEIRVLSPTAILGYGFPLSSFEAGVARRPHAIAVDAGSVDPGPYYLGAGVSFTDRDAVKRDLRAMLRAGRALKVPVIVGSAGGCGAEPHLAWNLDIVGEVAREEGWRLRVAVVHAEVPKALMLAALEAGDILPLPAGEALSREDLLATTRVVGQMGVEPLLRALYTGAEVVVAGRAYDPAVFAAVPIRRGFPAGLALHMGKILECATIAATPGSGSDCMLGTIRRDHFLVEPLNPERRCTVASVAAHTLYEKSDPYRLPGPGGTLDLTEAEFTQADDRSVRVRGSRFAPAERYTVKLEGARPVGFRTIAVAGARDPVFIANVDRILDSVRSRVRDTLSDVPAGDYRLLFHLYGRDGVMGALEPRRAESGHELGVVIEAVAPTQALANTVCSVARSTLLHQGYPGRLSTAGNLAFPYSPSDLEVGPVFRFSVHHLLGVGDPCELFRVEQVELGGRG